MYLVQPIMAVHSKQKDLFLEEHYISITMCIAQQNLTVELIINFLKKENRKLPPFSAPVHSISYLAQCPVLLPSFSPLPCLALYTLYIYCSQWHRKSAVLESNLSQA